MRQSPPADASAAEGRSSTLSPMSPMSRLSRSLPPIYAVAALRLMMPLLVLPLVASRLGPEAFGRLSFILVWSGLLGMLVEGGFLASATRLAVNADAAQRWRLAQQVFTTRCVACVPTVLLAFAVVHWMGHGLPSNAELRAGVALADDRVGDGLAIAALACAVGWPATWYLQATQQLGCWARVEGVVYAALLVATWGFAHSVAAYVALQLAASAALAIVGWQRLRRELSGARSAARSSTREEADRRSSLWSSRELLPGLRLGWTMLPVSLLGAAYSFALPAAASSRLTPADLGRYFIADRIVRALINAADPVFSVVYPRIVQRFALGAKAALRYAAGWAIAGTAAGSALLLALHLVLPLAAPWLGPRGAGLDAAAMRQVLFTLGWLLPLLLGWKFFGYWMLGSHRVDTAYRASIVVGGIVGTAAALTFGGAAGAIGLAWTAVGVELLVIAVSVVGSVLTMRRR